MLFVLALLYSTIPTKRARCQLASWQKVAAKGRYDVVKGKKVIYLFARFSRAFKKRELSKQSQEPPFEAVYGLYFAGASLVSELDILGMSNLGLFSSPRKKMHY